MCVSSSQAQSLDVSEGKLTLTLRPSDLKIPDLQSKGAVEDILSSFQTYVSERCLILEEMKLAEDTPLRSLSSLARAFVPGGRVSGHVTSLENDNAVVELAVGVKGMVVKASMHG